MMLNKARIFRTTKINIGKPFELTGYYGKKLTEEDISTMAGVVKEKMIQTQEQLVELTSKKKVKNESSKK